MRAVPLLSSISLYAGGTHNLFVLTVCAGGARAFSFYYMWAMPWCFTICGRCPRFVRVHYMRAVPTTCSFSLYTGGALVLFDLAMLPLAILGWFELCSRSGLFRAGNSVLTRFYFSVRHGSARSVPAKITALGGYLRRSSHETTLLRGRVFIDPLAVVKKFRSGWVDHILLNLLTNAACVSATRPRRLHGAPYNSMTATLNSPPRFSTLLLSSVCPRKIS